MSQDINDRLIGELAASTADALEAHFAGPVDVVMFVLERATGTVHGATTLEAGSHRDFMRHVAQQTSISAYQTSESEAKS